MFYQGGFNIPITAMASMSKPQTLRKMSSNAEIGKEQVDDEFPQELVSNEMKAENQDPIGNEEKTDTPKPIEKEMKAEDQDGSDDEVDTEDESDDEVDTDDDSDDEVNTDAEDCDESPKIFIFNEGGDRSRVCRGEVGAPYLTQGLPEAETKIALENAKKKAVFCSGDILPLSDPKVDMTYLKYVCWVREISLQGTREELIEKIMNSAKNTSLIVTWCVCDEYEYEEDLPDWVTPAEALARAERKDNLGSDGKEQKFPFPRGLSLLNPLIISKFAKPPPLSDILYEIRKAAKIFGEDNCEHYVENQVSPMKDLWFREATMERYDPYNIMKKKPELWNTFQKYKKESDELIEKTMKIQEEEDDGSKKLTLNTLRLLKQMMFEGLMERLVYDDAIVYKEWTNPKPDLAPDSPLNFLPGEEHKSILLLCRDKMVPPPMQKEVFGTALIYAHLINPNKEENENKEEDDEDPSTSDESEEDSSAGDESDEDEDNEDEDNKYCLCCGEPMEDDEDSSASNESEKEEQTEEEPHEPPTPKDEPDWAPLPANSRLIQVISSSGEIRYLLNLDAKESDEEGKPNSKQGKTDTGNMEEKHDVEEEPAIMFMKYSRVPIKPYDVERIEKELGVKPDEDMAEEPVVTLYGATGTPEPDDIPTPPGIPKLIIRKVHNAYELNPVPQEQIGRTFVEHELDLKTINKMK